MKNGKSISSAEQLIANIDKKERMAFKRFFFKIFLISLFLFILFATLNLGKADFGSVNLPVFAMSVFVASIRLITGPSRFRIIRVWGQWYSDVHFKAFAWLKFLTNTLSGIISTSGGRQTGLAGEGSP